MADLREKRLELILQQLEGLPTLPAVALRVLQITGDPTTDAGDVATLIENDPSLTARILQLIHRGDQGISAEIHTVERAVVLLGFQAVRNAVLAATVVDVFVPAETDSGLNRAGFWRHCLSVACCAELLAESMGGDEIDPSEAFVCGLLHDLGKIALDAILPKSYARVVEAADLLRGNIADIERSVIGLDHLIAGKRLGERWLLPQVIVDCIWLHGQLPEALPASVRCPPMVSLITLADQVAREQHLGYSGNYSPGIPRGSLLEGLGLNTQVVQAVQQRMVERIQSRAQILGLGEQTTGEVYLKALAQANHELVRTTGQLEEKSRRLRARAQLFDALSGFQSGLRADASSQDVLRAIAHTATDVLQTQLIAAFSLPPGQEYAQVVLCNAQGEVIETSLIEATQSRELLNASRPPSAIDRHMPKAAPTPDTSDAKEHSAKTTEPVFQAMDAAQGPVLPASNELEWLIEMISPRLPEERRFWVPLAAGGDCIGGVVWGAAAGESHRLGSKAHEITAIAAGWRLALRTAQIREESSLLAEQLADANRRLQAAQVEIVRARTMSSVGEMAAGAAHEMNNPLAVISGRSQLLSAQLTDPKQKAAAHLINEQANRLSSIITELMAFARPEQADPKPADLAELIDRALHEAKMQNDSADRVIEVTMGEAPPVLVDARQVTAALTAVVENALQATDPVSGHLAIHAAFDAYSSRVVVTIADDGCGMDEQTVRRAFDPFFSAKPAGRRRGLGLAKAMRWVESSGGSIRLESRPGEGTRCMILLPAMSDPPVVVAIAAAAASKLKKA